MWKDTDSKFRPILQDLARHKRLIQEYASLAKFEEIQAIRVKMEAEFEDRKENEQLNRRVAVFDWLGAAPIEEDQEMKADSRKGYPGVCSWILKDRKFNSWMDQDSQTSPFLWVTGIPGAGKTFYWLLT
jgi:hypothetical protein